MRHGVKPAQAADEQENFPYQRGKGCGCECLLAPLKDVTGNRRDKGIRDQISGGWPDQLGDAAWTSRTEHGHAGGSLQQVKRERRKATPGAKSESQQQHGKVLN